MSGKAALVALILAFGLVAFMGGTQAPASVTASLSDWAVQASTWLGVASQAQAASAPSAAASNAAPQAAPQAASAPVAAASQPPMALSQLWVPAKPTAGDVYALQIGQLVDRNVALSLAKSYQTPDLKINVLAVQDGQGQSWFVVTVGQYATPEQAKAQRTYVAGLLNLHSGLDVVRSATGPSPAAAKAASASSSVGPPQANGPPASTSAPAGQ